MRGNQGLFFAVNQINLRPVVHGTEFQQNDFSIRALGDGYRALIGDMILDHSPTIPIATHFNPRRILLVGVEAATGNLDSSRGAIINRQGPIPVGRQIHRPKRTSIIHGRERRRSTQEYREAASDAATRDNAAPIFNQMDFSISRISCFVEIWQQRSTFHHPAMSAVRR